jgi:cation diffusion facilitator family transporter
VAGSDQRGEAADQRDDPEQESGGEGTFTVLLALGANLGVGLLKLFAGLVSGSGALLSEAAHSVSDSTTEVLLLVALRRSDRPADRAHPFGYGKERYFWSMLAAVAIFVSGAAFSVFEGLHTILGPQHEAGPLWINYPVLALAMVLEAVSFRQAAGRLRRVSRRRRQSVRDYLLLPSDPTVNSVVLEDSTALGGIVVAAAGVALHQLTGAAVWDGIASLIIGVLLLIAAFVLARANEALLIGRQADSRLVRAIEGRLEAADEVVDVVDLLTMMVGTGKILLCARVDFEDSVTAGELERACVRIDAELREEFAELDEIFIQPASRADSSVRERVQARYGRVLADE